MQGHKRAATETKQRLLNWLAGVSWLGEDWDWAMGVRIVAKAAESRASDESLSPGSALCTRCGLCCVGAIHDRAVLDPEEIASAQALGLAVVEGEQPVFALPCPRLEGTVCTIYGQRPRVCSRYRCQVLRDLDDGAVNLSEAMAKVDMAKSLLQRLHESLMPGMSLWQATEASMRPLGPEVAGMDAPQRVGHMRLRLAATALNLYIDRNFRNARDGRLLKVGARTMEGRDQS